MSASELGDDAASGTADEVRLVTKADDTQVSFIRKSLT